MDVLSFFSGSLASFGIRLFGGDALKLLGFFVSGAGFVLENFRVGAREDDIWVVAAEFLSEVEIAVQVCVTDCGDGVDEFDEGFKGRRLLVFEDTRGEIAVNSSEEAVGGLSENVMLEVVFAGGESFGVG